VGPPPDGLACTLWPPNSVPATTFYRTIDTMIHKTGGSRESSSRVLFEAYAHGVVPIVERDFAFPELVIHGDTGFMASSTEEMSEYASLLAHDPARHRRMAENGRKHLEEQFGDADRCWQGWQAVLGVRA
jgi:glycosyltransferase involved in cell wall biosynthesis